MHRTRLNELKHIIGQSDNSESGKYARQKAIAEIQDWCNSLFAFAKKNPGTAPARACYEQITELDSFCSKYR